MKKKKNSNLKEPLLELFHYIKIYLPLIIPALIFAIISSILSIIGPDKLKEMTDVITKGIITGIDLNKVKQIGIFLIVIYSLSLLFGYFVGFVMTIVTNRCSKRLREDISIKINKLPLKYFDNTTIGDILSRVTNDVDTISMSLNTSLSTLVSAITMLIGSSIMMFKTDYIMALVAIGASLIGFLLMGLILSRSQKYFNYQQKNLGQLNGHIEEAYTGHDIIKAYNKVESSERDFKEINNSLYKNNLMSQFLSGLMGPLMGFIGNFGYVSVCVTGAILVLNNHITFGVIVAFMIYIRLFTSPLSQIAQGATTLQSTAAASSRVFSFLKEQEMEEDESIKVLDPSKVKGDIEFKNVYFGYKPGKTIIKDFSFKAKPGSVIAIVGPTGAGKTTIVNLLMKFYNIDKGDILIDNTSIKDLSRENVHELFNMVLQDTWVFNDTIENNIKYNNDNISIEDIEKVCKKIGLDHFIRTLPDGYKTVLSEVESLSEGQKQLLTIARAYLAKKPFTILDEATSSVDTRTEILVSDAMEKLTKDKTSFIIAHRLSTIKNADLILVVKDGNIVEQGTHTSLLQEKGFYSELYNSQFEIN